MPRPRAHQAARQPDGSVAAYRGHYFPRTVRVGRGQVAVAEAPGPGSTGREVWRVAEHLVSLFENELSPDMLEGKRIVELGCGCGLLGLALAIISGGKAEVILTDYDEAALEMAQLNVEINSLSHCVTVQKFSWGSSPAKLLGDKGVDFVVGSDIIYHPHCTPKLQKTLSELVGSQTTVLLAHEHRQPGLEGRFYSDAQTKLHLKCDKVRRRYLDKREDASLMSIYQLTKPAGYGPQPSAYSMRPSTIVGSRPVSAMSSLSSVAGYQRSGQQQQQQQPASSNRPQSAMPSSSRSIRTTPQSRPGSAYSYQQSYRRPQSARNARTSHDSPALTRASVGEVLSINLKGINSSRNLLSREAMSRVVGPAVAE